MIIGRKYYIFYFWESKNKTYEVVSGDDDVEKAIEMVQLPTVIESPITYDIISDNEITDNDIIINNEVIDNKINIENIMTSKSQILEIEDNWPNLSLAIFTDWYPFFQLGLPGAISLFLEWF